MNATAFRRDVQRKPGQLKIGPLFQHGGTECLKQPIGNLCRTMLEPKFDLVDDRGWERDNENQKRQRKSQFAQNAKSQKPKKGDCQKTKNCNGHNSEVVFDRTDRKSVV